MHLNGFIKTVHRCTFNAFRIHFVSYINTSLPRLNVSSQQATINDRYLPSIRSSRLCITLFNTVNLMPLHLQYVRNGGGVRRGLMKAVTNRYENFGGREWSGLIRYIKEKIQEFFHYLTENSNSQAKQAVLITSSKTPRKYFILIAISFHAIAVFPTLYATQPQSINLYP